VIEPLSRLLLQTHQAVLFRVDANQRAVDQAHWGLEVFPARIGDGTTNLTAHKAVGFCIGGG